MGNLVKRIYALSPAQLALLERRLQAETLAPAKPPLSRYPRDRDAFPLSFAQERLWFFDQFQPNTPMYNIPGTYSFAGPLNVAALEQSLNEIVRRHEILRMTFAAVDGEPVQIIAPTRRQQLPVVDLRDMPDTTRYLEAQRLITQEAVCPFDLGRGPLLRTTLLRLGDAEHILLLTMHHIISDGWSVGVLLRELTVLYDAYSAGRSSPLPKLPIQYVDFALFQRQWLQGDILKTHLAYWKRQLDGAPSVLSLPTDRPRLAIQTFRGAVQSCAVSASVTAALKALSQRAEVTLFMTLLAAFQTLLYRYSGQEDQVVGTLIANRNHTAIEGLIGFFVNTLVLRTDLSGNPSFLQLLARVREVTWEAYAHQDLPFEKIVEELQPTRSMGHHPVFQVLFTLQNAPMGSQYAAATPGDAPAASNGTAKFDLALFMAETGQGLVGSVEYNTDLFDATTILQMLEHFTALLEGVATNPEWRLLDIPLRMVAQAGGANGPSRLQDTYAEAQFSFERNEE